jgi:hypothetical protein
MNIPDDLSLKAEIDQIFKRIDDILAAVKPYQPAEKPAEVAEPTECDAQT